MIHTVDLVHRFGDTTVLDHISLRIADGEFLVLTGANGSGKTTLVRHFNGLLHPDDGEVFVDDQPVATDLIAARTKVAMVFQHPRDCFVAATVGADVAFGPENLGLPRESINERVRDALTAVGMSDRRDDRLDQLSGGEQARVAIAGALAMSPDHLILDEPFPGLDWPARQNLLAHIDELSTAGTSIIVVTHDLRDLMNRADRIVALADGRIAYNDAPHVVRDHLTDVDVRPC